MNLKFFRCKICGKIIIILKDPGTPTICCGEPRYELKAGTTDAAVEKHVPVVTLNGNTASVTVGSVTHPMEEKHYIEWIVLETEKGYQLKNLKPGEAPKADFILADGDKFVKAFAYCNLHSLWASDNAV